MSGSWFRFCFLKYDQFLIKPPQGPKTNIAPRSLKIGRTRWFANLGRFSMLCFCSSPKNSWKPFDDFLDVWLGQVAIAGLVATVTRIICKNMISKTFVEKKFLYINRKDLYLSLQSSERFGRSQTARSQLLYYQSYRKQRSCQETKALSGLDFSGMGVSKLGYPKMDGFIMENPIKMDDLGIYFFFPPLEIDDESASVRWW